MLKKLSLSKFNLILFVKASSTRKNSMIKKILLLFICTALCASCVSRKKIVYYQNLSDVNTDQVVNYESRIKSDDQLMIVVSSPAGVQEAAADFNLPVMGVSGVGTTSIDATNGQLRFQTYLVDAEGNIEFPVLGTIKLGGLTRAEAVKKLKDEISVYFKNPIINMRIVNYEVSVTGEVIRPGTFNIQTERITLPEALSMAGDMTIYGNRSNVLILREINGQKTYNYVDMTKADFINSPFYYLTQNDLVYVEPNKTKINSSAVGPNISVAISAVSVLIALAALLVR